MLNVPIDQLRTLTTQAVEQLPTAPGTTGFRVPLSGSEVGPGSSDQALIPVPPLKKTRLPLLLPGD
jgi:hypothetical protein